MQIERCLGLDGLNRGQFGITSISGRFSDAVSKLRKCRTFMIFDFPQALGPTSTVKRFSDNSVNISQAKEVLDMYFPAIVLFLRTSLGHLLFSMSDSKPCEF